MPKYRPASRPDAMERGAERLSTTDRSFVTAAVTARRLIARLLDEPVPRGRASTAKATAEARVVLAVLYLTLGYSKAADTFTMPQMEWLTGYTPARVGRLLDRLADRGWFRYTPANRHRGRPLNTVALPMPPRRSGDGGPQQPTEPIGEVTAAVRAIILRVLTTGQPLASLRVTAVLLEDLSSWLLMSGPADCGAIALRTGLDPKTVGRKLKALAGLEALAYTPGRGRGIHGRVRLYMPHDAVRTSPGKSVRQEPEPQLLSDERALLNGFLGEVLAVLANQEAGQDSKVANAIDNMRRRDSFARMALSLLEAGHGSALAAALTRSPWPNAPAYQGCHNLAGSLYRRVQDCHTRLGPPVARTAATPPAGDAMPNPVASLLSDFLGAGPSGTD